MAACFLPFCIRGFQKLGQDPLKYKTDPYPFFYICDNVITSKKIARMSYDIDNNDDIGEEGQDAGGLLREWYVIISREIFNPNYALFKSSAGDR